MKIDEETVNKLKNLNEEQLRAAIADIADALGATPAQKRRAMNNCGTVRNQLLRKDGAELSRQLSKMTSEQQSEILARLKR